MVHVDLTLLTMEMYACVIRHSVELASTSFASLAIHHVLLVTREDEQTTRIVLPVEVATLRYPSMELITTALTTVHPNSLMVVLQAAQFLLVRRKSLFQH